MFNKQFIKGILKGNPGSRQPDQSTANCGWGRSVSLSAYKYMVCWRWKEYSTNSFKINGVYTL